MTPTQNAPTGRLFELDTPTEARTEAEALAADNIAKAYTADAADLFTPTPTPALDTNGEPITAGRTYEAYAARSHRRNAPRTMFAIASGADALGMIARSANASLLSFRPVSA